MIFLETFLPYISLILFVIVVVITPLEHFVNGWNELKRLCGKNKYQPQISGKDSDDMEFLFYTDHFINDMNGTDKDSSW